MTSLEAQLVKAVHDENLDLVRDLIEKGANINHFRSGRSPLSIAAYLGNLPMMELILNCGNFSGISKERCGKKNLKVDSGSMMIPHRSKRKRSSEVRGNNGYYVVIHGETEDGKPLMSEVDVMNSNRGHSVDEDSTPEGMDNLEWDEEEVDNPTNSYTDEDELWADQYRWYAKILSNTCVQSEEITSSCDVNLQDSIGRTAIHYAAEVGHTSAVKLLINAGSKVDIGDVDCLTPLHLACNRGHYGVAEVLLSSGALTDAKTTDKLTSLHYAASRGFSDIVELLIKYGANINPLDATDRTPLKLAASRNLLPVAEILIKSGAKVNLEDNKGYSPLCEAVWAKSVPMAQMLINAGARIRPSSHLLHFAILHRHEEMARLLIDVGALPNSRNGSGCTPLYAAAITHQLGTIKMLLENGAGVDLVSGSDRTPLQGAICSLERQHLNDVIKVLVDGGADINKVCLLDSPLSFALHKNKLEAAAYLLGLGADPAMKLEGPLKPTDPMMLAIKLGHFSIATIIVFSGRYDLDRLLNNPYLRPSGKLKSKAQFDSFMTFLNHQRSNPFRLTELCRIAIRQVGIQRCQRMEDYINSLNLPPLIVDYLMFRDIPVVSPAPTPPEKPAEGFNLIS